MLGSRQSPALLSSFKPCCPLDNLLHSSSARCHVLKPKGSAFLSQTSSVKLSVTVPSRLSVKRGLGHSTPAWSSPSWPVPAQSGIKAPTWLQHVTCPVRGTFVLFPRTGHMRLGLIFRSKTVGPMPSVIIQPRLGAAIREVLVQ